MKVTRKPIFTRTSCKDYNQCPLGQGFPARGELAPGDTGQYLGTFLIFTPGMAVDNYWPLEGGGQKCCWTPVTAGDSPHQKELSNLNVNSAKVENLL